ncbi:MAG: transporter [Proteobacteria bacterium]|nr:transporter [Pseudomonadota bacterium]
MNARPAKLSATFPFKPIGALLAVLFVTGCAITPQPISVDARRSALPEERANLFLDQEPVNGPITLDEALARAIKYNLDYRLKLMEEALAQKQLDLSRADLLPRLTAAAGYNVRDNENGASSRDLATGNQSLVPSTSQDKGHRTADLTLAWNVLDFGVSYYQAQQQADRTLVAQERRRKTVHLVIQQVRQAYWQAVGAQELEAKISPILEQARQALNDSRKIEAEKLQAPLETLNYQRQLLDIIRQLEAIHSELSQAKPRLASLMNLEPGKSLMLAQPAKLEIPQLQLPLDKMEETALLHRPELMEARYNERISLLETRKAVAKLLPGLEFSLGAHYDSNSFLVNNAWRDAGIRVSWNLLNLLNASDIRATAEAQHEIAARQRLAVSMAVLTQAHVAYRDYTGRLRQYELSSEMDQVEQRILGHSRNAVRSDAQGKLQEIRAAASALMSELRLYQSYGALQGAYGQVLSSMGLDPLPDTMASHDLSAVRQALQGMDARWAAELRGTEKP